MTAAPYHRLSAQRRVRATLEPVLAFAYWAIAIVVIDLVTMNLELADELEEPISFALMGASLALLIPATRLAARTFRRAPGLLSSVAGRLHWRWLLRCIALAFLFLVLAVAADVALSRPETAEAHWPGWAAFLPLLALIVVVVPFQAAGEEHLFRGTLIQAIGAWSKSPWPAIVLSSAAFAAVHWVPIEATVFLFATAVVDAWLTIETGGIEAAVAGHTVHNVGAFVMLAATGERIDIVDDADFSWVLAASYSGFYVAYGWAVIRLAPKRLQR